ncbi:MAG TPA: hypothetical protein VLA00_17125 [Xanthobacteraceae bacterium]|nr:hypothetical protein [Xanthobacteraceae bacterium]
MSDFDLASPIRSLSDPASDAFPVTPSDSAIIASRALYVGGSGDVAVVTAAGNDVVFKAVPDGAILPIRVRKVKSTGTTATFIVSFI